MDITLLRTFSTTRRIKTGTWSRVQPTFLNAIAPCMDACPLGIDTPRIVELVLQGKIRDACMYFLEINPFPFITGRICPHFCMDKCNRVDFDEATNIREIERFLGDVILDEKLFPAKKAYKDRRIAVIGSGPSGLSFAWYASLYGCEVTVFEEKSHPGGMLYWGIPNFRLSKDIVGDCVRRLEEVGVRFETERLILPEDVEFLKREYDKVVLACGLTKPKKLPVEGAEYALLGLDVLSSYNLEGTLPEGNKAVVIGGGNVAIDVALCFLKNGKEVVLVCVEPKDEMPALYEEVEEALSLGLRIEDSTGVVRMEKGSKGLVLEIEDVVITGEEGGFKKVKFLGNRRILTADVVVMAVGQDRAFDGYNTDTVIGDYAMGPSTVAQAIASGRRAAFITCGMGVSDVVYERDRDDIISYESLNVFYFEKSSSLKEIQNTEDLIYEAKRCFSCGYCNSCGNCWIFCPDVSILFDENGKPQLDAEHCKGCGICSEECPRSVIVFPISP